MVQINRRRPDAAEGIPWRSATLHGILACTFVLPLGVAMLSPVLPLFRDAFVLSDPEASLLFTLYFLPAVVCAPIWGLLVDRYGPRIVLIPCLLLYGLLGAGIAFLDALVPILVFRILQGAASAAIFIITVTYISAVFDGIQRNAVLGANAGVLFIGAAIFPFLGGMLGGVHWQLPFLTYLAAVPVAIYVYVRLADPPPIDTSTEPHYLTGAITALPPRKVGALYGSTLSLETIAFGGILTILPFHMAATFGARPFTTGVAITAMMLVSAVVAISNGRLVKHRSNHRLIALSFCCYGVGFLVIVLAPGLSIVMLGASIVGIGFGLAMPSIDASISRIAPPQYLGGALSLRTAMTFLGRAGGPVVFATLGVFIGYELLLLVAGLATLAAGGIGLVLTDNTPMTLIEPVER